MREEQWGEEGIGANRKETEQQEGEEKQDKSEKDTREEENG